MGTESLSTLTDFAVDTAWRAGKITLEYFQTGLTVETKPDLSPVTEADRRTESLIRDAVRHHFPEHSVVGEEYGVHESGSPYRWIIDPIDGTQAYIHGVPFYGVLIGLEHQGRAILGVVNCPAVGDMLWASSGEGCYWNGRRARVSQTLRMEQALVCTSGEEYFEKAGRLPRWRAIGSVARRLRTWGDCYGYVLVATGRSDAMVDPLMNVWDCAPLLPIIEEAGGRFTDWKGVPTIRGGDAVASNGALHEGLLSVLGSGPAE